MLCVAALAACSSVKDDVDPPAELVDFEPRLSVEKVWSTSVGADSESSVPLQLWVDEHYAYVADYEGVVTALNVADAKEAWQVETELALSAGLDGRGEFLVAGSRYGEIIALERSSGEERWRAAVSSEVITPPYSAENVTVVRTVDGRVFGLDARSGLQLWVVEHRVPLLTLRGVSAPVFSAGTVFVGFANGKLAAIALYDGSVAWEVNVASPKGRSELERMVDIDADPVIDGDVIYVAAFQGRVLAVDKESGRVLWERDISSSTGLAVANGVVYVTDQQGHLWALEQETGASLWRQDDLHMRALTAPVIQDGYVVVGDFEGYLHWIAADSGEFVARREIDDEGFSVPPVVKNGVLYATGKSGTVVALRLGDKD